MLHLLKFEHCSQVQRTGILTLLEPFLVPTWILFLLTVISLSGIHTIAERSSFLLAVCSIMFNCMNAHPTPFESSRGPIFLICVASVLMSSYPGRLYGNDFITRFTDPSELFEVVNHVRCDSNAICNHKSTVPFMMIHGQFVCGMNVELMNYLEIPSHAVKYRLKPSNLPKRRLYGNRDFADGTFLAFDDA